MQIQELLETRSELLAELRITDYNHPMHATKITDLNSQIALIDGEIRSSIIELKQYEEGKQNRHNE